MRGARSATLAIPARDLERMKGYLSPSYGAQVWESPEARILVVRVPGDDPDIVNDVERAVEHLSAADVRGLTAALLVGGKRMASVPVPPFVDLIAQRVRRDAEMCGPLRAELAGNQHRIFQRPGDSQHLWRMAVRIPIHTVQAVSDDDLVRITENLGPLLEDASMRAVQVVYLIADDDHVRLEGGLFFQDLRDRWNRQGLGHQMAAALATRLQGTHAFPSTPPAAPGSPPPAALPTFQSEAAQAESTAAITRTPASSPASPSASSTLSAPPTLHNHERIPVGRLLDFAPPRRLPPPAPLQPPARTTSPAELRSLAEVHAGVDRLADPQAFEAAQLRLRALGYDLLVRPAARPDIDLAGERAAAPQRIIVRFEERLTPSVAGATVAAAEELGVDAAFVVAPQAQPDAQRQLVAGRGRWLRPDELPGLEL